MHYYIQTLGQKCLSYCHACLSYAVLMLDNMHLFFKSMLTPVMVCLLEIKCILYACALSALTLLIGCQEEHLACKN